MPEAEPNDATQTVFGAGRERARVMLVGEQPDDREFVIQQHAATSLRYDVWKGMGRHPRALPL